MKVENINILQFQAKDIFDGKRQKVKSLKTYKATLDYSLETIKLEEVYKKIYRNNKFTFEKNGKLYSDAVISVMFTYKTDSYNTSELREMLYKEGFDYNGNHYVRFKRSSGSSRVGKCLFILEPLFDQMMKWSLMGLKFQTDEQLDLASLEAYISLTTSSIIDTINIKPNEILVIDDFISTFRDRVLVTSIDENNRLETKEDEIDMSNSIFDGQSLMDSSLFDEKYSDKGMLLLRNRFFKSACFNTNIQQFFKDNNINKISQLNGFTLADNISDIKLITTPSSIKFLKFGTLEKYFELLEPMFGIVKYDKPTHHFNGDMVQTHYQLLNTLQFSKEEMRSFLDDSLNYIRLLKQHIPTLRFHLKMNIDKCSVKGFDTTSNFVYSMLGINDAIIKTSVFKEFRKDLIKSYVNNIRSGRVLVKGNYSVLLGNGYEMLLHSINKFDGTSCIGIDCVFNKRFEFDKNLVGIRSPHITMGNVWLIRNTYNKNIDKYFNLSDQIVYVNSIDNNMLERLNGCDFDSDAILLTDNELIIQKVKENYNNFLVPTSNVVSSKAIRLNNDWHRFDLDEKTSVNKIGEIINLSQVLNSWLWEVKKQGGNYSDIYKDVSKLAVMSCIEIDRAKKEFVVDNVIELKDLKEKYKFLIKKKPMFFYFLPKDDLYLGSVDIAKHRNYETSMDYLEDIMTKSMKGIRAKKQKRIQIKDLFDNESVSISDADRRQCKNVIEMTEALRRNCNEIWVCNDYNSQEKYSKTIELKNSYISELASLKISISTMKKILYSCESKFQRIMLVSLFESHKKTFMELVLKQKKPIEIIQKDDNGEFFIYGNRYKIYKNQ